MQRGQPECGDTTPENGSWSKHTGEGDDDWWCWCWWCQLSEWRVAYTLVKGLRCWLGWCQYWLCSIDATYLQGEAGMPKDVGKGFPKVIEAIQGKGSVWYLCECCVDCGDCSMGKESGRKEERDISRGHYRLWVKRRQENTYANYNCTQHTAKDYHRATEIQDSARDSFNWTILYCIFEYACHCEYTTIPHYSTPQYTHHTTPLSTQNHITIHHMHLARSQEVVNPLRKMEKPLLAQQELRTIFSDIDVILNYHRYALFVALCSAYVSVVWCGALYCVVMSVAGFCWSSFNTGSTHGLLHKNLVTFSSKW